MPFRRMCVRISRAQLLGWWTPFLDVSRGNCDVSEPNQISAKKAFLYALIGSVGLCAFFGIAAILSGRFGWFEIRVLLTTITIAAASVCGLGCGAFLAAKPRHPLPLAGLALTALAAFMIIAGLWTNAESEGYWKIAASSSVFAVACAHLSLLSMARLADWFQWSLVAAYVTIFGVAALIVLAISAEGRGDGMFQLLGVAAIFDAAITLLVPIFHRLSRSEGAMPGEASGISVAEIDAEIARLQARIGELQRMKQHAR